MADTVKQIGIKQQDGTYSMKDIEVDYSNVAGLSTQATSAKATADKNNKDITTYIASGSHSGSNLVLIDGAGTSSNVGLGMTGATSNANGEAGFVPQPTSADLGKFLSADGTWDTPPGEQYVGSSNISIDSNTNAIDLTNTTVSSGTYGPSADVTGTNGTTISVPNISVDAKGRITNITNKTYTSVDTGSKVFTGSLSEWNQLSTAEKKTYDFISNDEPGGTGDEFPANRVSYDNTVSRLTANDAQEAIDELSSAENITYDNTDSGLIATNVQGAVDEINNKIGTKKVLATATADGVKTLSTLLDELYPYRKVGAILQISDYAIFNTRYSTQYGCVSTDGNGNPLTRSVILKSSGSIIKTYELATGTLSDQSARVPSSGTKIELYIKL